MSQLLQKLEARIASEQSDLKELLRKQQKAVSWIEKRAFDSHINEARQSLRELERLHTLWSE
ncbi:MAG: hypothetical protein HY457_02880 [Parcubacteria group bacterium]|nr:hypothetical protein [Parcubacteria group bacterium]